MSIQLSLLTPTGHLTLGNYLGAIRAMVHATTSSECYYGISNLHALTTEHEPSSVRATTREMAALLLACGLEPDKATLFVQSQVPAHTGLAYLLECTATTGELNRMIQFKEKGRGRSETRASLFTYPVLMAADILLYGATEVPVGDDQRQHVELTRDLAQRFNRRYGEVFIVPKVVTPSIGARVMDLADPTVKMSKSNPVDAGVVYLLDHPDTVSRKIKRAVTDSDGDVRYDVEAKPGVSNLLDLISACTDQSIDAVTSECGSYGALKTAATQAALETLAPIQATYAALDDAKVRAVFDAGSARAREVTAPVLAAAQSAIGVL